MTMAYCVRCRAQREVRNPQAMVMKNRKEAITGVCPICGTRLFRIGDHGGAVAGVGAFSSGLN